MSVVLAVTLITIAKAIYFQDDKNQVLYDKFLISIADDALRAWSNSEKQLESLQISMDQLQEDNIGQLKQIDILQQALDDKSTQIQDWMSNYAELRGKYAEVTKQENSMHPTKTDSHQIKYKQTESDTTSSSQNNQQSVIMAASIIVVLVVLAYPICRYAHSINTGINNARLRASIVNALSPAKGRKRTQSFKDTPDPLSNIIVMDDTPTNSTPTSPKPIGLPSLSLPDFIKNRKSSPAVINTNDVNGIIFEEEDVKISEIDIPDRIR